MLKVGQWMRDRKTQEAVQIVDVDFFVVYSNADVEGQVRADMVDTMFLVLDKQPEDAEPAYNYA